MNLEEALELFPEESGFRSVLPGLLDPDLETRAEAFDRLRRLERSGSDPDPYKTTWKIGAREAIALLRAATEMSFPPQRYEWNDTTHDLIFPLVRSPHPELVPLARAGYPRLSHAARCAVLALLGACGTRTAAEAFMGCIREHGWPERVYARVFSELPKLAPHAEVLFPELVVLAGENLGGVVDVLVGAIASGTLDASRVDLEPVAPLVTRSLEQALSRAAEQQETKGIAWRFSEKYAPVRQEAGCWLDLAGHLKSTEIDPLLREALSLLDPLLLAFAAASILRRGGEVPAPVLDAVAACHETRTTLFNLLRGQEKLALFPSAWRTWDAFAAAEMVEWLRYPAELGREPDELEAMAVLRAGEQTLYVWRFGCEGEQAYAGVSGPYTLRGEPAPLHGTLTFSRFDPWESGTAEHHAGAVLKTLQAWSPERRGSR